jgi:hypothetical protein
MDGTPNTDDGTPPGGLEVAHEVFMGVVADLIVC